MKKNILSLIILLFGLMPLQAVQKIYLIHGFAGLGIEMQKISYNLTKAGFNNEIISYPSLLQDVDTVAKTIYHKILADKPDTVSFITHSMGGLVARSLYHYIKPGDKFPVIKQMIMIAPPNKGTPVADYFIQSKLITSLAGPNIKNLTTDSKTGASRYPVPKCEVGIILGIAKNKFGYNLFLEEDNDGLVIPKHAKLGVEKEIAFIKASHTGLLLKNQTVKLVLNFLKYGKFSDKL